MKGHGNLESAGWEEKPSVGCCYCADPGLVTSASCCPSLQRGRHAARLDRLPDADVRRQRDLDQDLPRHGDPSTTPLARAGLAWLRLGLGVFTTRLLWLLSSALAVDMIWFAAEKVLAQRMRQHIQIVQLGSARGNAFYYCPFSIRIAPAPRLCWPTCAGRQYLCFRGMRLAIVDSILSLARPWRVTLTVVSPELLCYSAQSGAVWTVA